MILALLAAATLTSNALPPERFRGNPGEVRVRFVDPVELLALCEPHGRPAGARGNVRACVTRIDGRDVAVMPDPCKQAGAYARLLCHETGHLNGWPGEHGD